MDAPKIQTAIPKQRYRLGDYTAVVLGEIESGDGRRYEHILALVREGETKPSFYVTAEKNPRSRVQEGSHCLCVISEHFTEELGSSDRWRDVDAFAGEALALAAKVLGLGEVVTTRLM